MPPVRNPYTIAHTEIFPPSHRNKLNVLYNSIHPSLSPTRDRSHATPYRLPVARERKIEQPSVTVPPTEYAKSKALPPLVVAPPSGTTSLRRRPSAWSIGSADNSDNDDLSSRGGRAVGLKARQARAVTVAEPVPVAAEPTAVSEPNAIPSAPVPPKIPKPDGEEGRPGREGGYTLEAVLLSSLGWDKKQYKKVLKYVKGLVLRDMDCSVTFTDQSLHLIRQIRTEAAAEYPALDRFENGWAVDDYIRKVLKYQKAALKLRNLEAMATANAPQQQNVEGRTRSGR